MLLKHGISFDKNFNQLFYICGITTDDVTKIFCLCNKQYEADDEEVAGNLNDIISDFDSSENKCVSAISINS